MDELKSSIGYLKDLENALLEKFDYQVNEDGTYTITAWKQEYRTEDTVIIPPNTTKIARLAFNGWGFKTLVLPEGLQEIGEYAFNTNDRLERVEFPSSLRCIEKNAFWGCSNLREVVFNDGLKEIENEAFQLCSSLTQVVIPKSVEKIGLLVFSNCGNLRNILCEAEEKPQDWNENWVDYFVRGKEICWGKTELEEKSYEYQPILAQSIEDFIFEKNERGELVVCGVKNEDATDLLFPDGVVAIKNRAFAWNSSVRKVLLPNGVKTVGDEAFYHCENILELVFPKTLTRIGHRAFDNCPLIKEIVLYDGVFMGADVFGDCTALTHIYCESEELLKKLNGYKKGCGGWGQNSLAELYLLRDKK